MQDRAETDRAVHTPIKIGDLLVEEGLIRSADLAKALALQETEEPLPLGRRLIKQGRLTREQLQHLLEHPDIRGAVGDFAVTRGSLSPERLAECRRSKPIDLPLEEALVAWGYLSNEDVKAFLEHQMNSPFLGELALRLGMISEADLREEMAKGAPRSIGEILCDLHLITPLDLNRVLFKYQKHQPLEEILLKTGLVGEKTLEKAMAERGLLPLGEFLVRSSRLTPGQLLAALSRQYNLPCRKACDLDAGERDAMARIVSESEALRLRLAPLSLKDATLTVAISDPSDLEGVHALRDDRVDLRIECVLVSEQDLKGLFLALYQDAPPPEAVSEALPREIPTPVSEAPPDQIRRILREAHARHAEAIHVDRTEEGCRVTLRVEGSRHVSVPSSTKGALFPPNLLDLLKELAGLTGPLPQDGIIRIPESHAAFSIATCPTLGGETATLRLLSKPPSPDALPEQVLAALKQAMASMSGLILASVPAGSNPSQTLHSLLGLVFRPDLRVVSVEEPIPFESPGILQIQVNSGKGLTFPGLLQAALRLAPDVLLAGNLSDRESTALGLASAQTGILFLGGMPAGDAVQSLAAFRDLSPDAAKHPAAVLAQRTVRKICPECSHPYLPGPEEWEPLFHHFPGHLSFHRGTGCPACGFSGFRGHLLLSEVLIPGKAVAQALARGDGEDDIRLLSVRSGMRTFIDDGLSKLSRTTLPEILGAVSPDAARIFKCNHADSPAGDVGYSIVVEYPARQREEIRRLHRTYEALMEPQTPRRNSPDDAFEAFVTDHYGAIARRFGCSRVRFSVERRSGKVHFLASPLPDSLPETP